MLADRITQGINLYENGAAPKLLMSGDHGRADYDEVNTMRAIAVEAGVPASDVFMDHAGFSTYESVYRARGVFGAKRVIIVTQQYHLYRALYVANALGLEAYGVSADLRPYANQAPRDQREVLARGKDFVTSILQPEPTYLGDRHPPHRQRRGHRGVSSLELFVDVSQRNVHGYYCPNRPSFSLLPKEDFGGSFPRK